MRQQKFKRGKEKMLSLAQESVDGQPVAQPAEEEDDDDGTQPTPSPSNVCLCRSKNLDMSVKSV